MPVAALALSPIKDGLQQQGEGCGGRHVKESYVKISKNVKKDKNFFFKKKKK